MDYVSIMFRAICIQEVLFIAIDAWERALFEFRPWSRLPELEAVVTGAI
jgi:hypothetical protein